MDITKDMHNFSLNKVNISILFILMTRAFQKPMEKSVAVPAKEFHSMQEGICSIFMIDVEPGRKAFRYDVDIKNVTRQKSLAKGADE